MMFEILVLAFLAFLCWQSVIIVNTLFKILEYTFQMDLEAEQGDNINQDENDK